MKQQLAAYRSRDGLLTLETRRQWIGAFKRHGIEQNKFCKQQGKSEIQPICAAAGREIRSWLEKVGVEALLELANSLRPW